jgi:hypothetical protein
MNFAILQALTAGIVIGGAFAWLQLQALRRNEFLAQRQQMPAFLRRLPGSGVRIAFLLLSLALVQVLVPGANKWWLTGSLLVSSSIPILWRLFQLAPRRN